MKNYTFIALFTLLSTFVVAQNDAYESAMQDALTQLKADEYQAAANSFERIANIAKEEWLPNYYSAYANMALAWTAMNKKEWKTYDAHIKKAMAGIEQAMAISTDNSELYVLKGYIYQAKIMKNPMVNGPRFSSTIVESLQTAINLNEDNPRAYYLLGQQWMNMPSFLGGGAEQAVPYLRKAAEKFATFEPASDLHPNWGKESNARTLEQAEQQL